MLLIALLVTFPFFCGAVPALPNSFAALTQQQKRMMQMEDFSVTDDTLPNVDEPTGRFQPSEQKAFVLKGRRAKNLLPPAVVPKLTADAKIISISSSNMDDEWGQMRQQKQPMRSFLPPTEFVVPKKAKTMGKQYAKQPKAVQEFGEDALTNPAAFFLQGAELDKIASPTCHLMGCTGPLANDGDIALEGRTGPGADGMRQCHQTFVPLNGCWERAAGRDSYPVGMVCTICCDCSAQLTAEMRRSRGWTNGYRMGQ